MWKLSPKSIVLAQNTEHQSSDFNPQFSDHTSFLAEKDSWPHPVPSCGVGVGSCCLLDLGHRNGRGLCKPAKALWDRLLGVTGCEQATPLAFLQLFLEAPASASDGHSPPVGDSRSQAHSMQMVPRAGCRGVKPRLLITSTLINW